MMIFFYDFFGYRWIEVGNTSLQCMKCASYDTVTDRVLTR